MRVLLIDGSEISSRRSWWLVHAVRFGNHLVCSTTNWSRRLRLFKGQTKHELARSCRWRLWSILPIGIQLAGTWYTAFDIRERLSKVGSRFTSDRIIVTIPLVSIKNIPSSGRRKVTHSGSFYPCRFAQIIATSWLGFIIFTSKFTLKIDSIPLVTCDIQALIYSTSHPSRLYPISLYRISALKALRGFLSLQSIALDSDPPIMLT